ncbi:hypothetical protein G6F37_006750 [Rhizopus arrhizus]|nr:hypothetical protein G6F38_006869 [Rhizopus arrhizus]KAG1157380.1 hypothetical protein G6F37_006750 [Rhizopus arrhizus]
MIALTSVGAYGVSGVNRLPFQRDFFSFAMTITEEKTQDENEMIDDLLAFKLPPDQLPGMDQLSKSILKTSTAIEIITSDPSEVF